MSELAMDTRATIIPTLRYRGAHAAIDWLERAFGFHAQFVAPDGEGGVAHAQLTFGNGMIMLGSAREDEFGRMQRPPESADAPVSQSPYVIVRDVDAHHARAVEAGAVVVMEPEDKDYGGRGYGCRDPEGNLWSFGSYDPWEDEDAGTP